MLAPNAATQCVKKFKVISLKSPSKPVTIFSGFHPHTVCLFVNLVESTIFFPETARLCQVRSLQNLWGNDP